MNNFEKWKDGLIVDDVVGYFELMPGANCKGLCPAYNACLEACCSSEDDCSTCEDVFRQWAEAPADE